ncbi:MAG TPA: hypothetical protein VKA90_01995 [Beijerinckiaceae bacterium]|jgi:hypothetical protein|nr:hypothetical protein [Beijerinckiaceae bacterium]
MTRTSALIALAAASALLTPVVVHATGAAPKAQASIEKAAPVAAAPESTATACARKVKVVYAGYGNMHEAACAVR